MFAALVFNYILTAISFQCTCRREWMGIVWWILSPLQFSLGWQTVFSIPSDAQYCLFKNAQYDLFLQLATTQELNKIKGEVRSVLGTIKPMNNCHACIN
jgi:hypothetical protein